MENPELDPVSKASPRILTHRNYEMLFCFKLLKVVSDLLHSNREPLDFFFFLYKIRPVAQPCCFQEDVLIWLGSVLREPLFHQNLKLGLRLVRAVALSRGRKCPSLLVGAS